MIEATKTQPEQTYDRVGIQQLLLAGNIATGRFDARATLRHYNHTTRAVDSQAIRIVRNDVLTLAAQRAADGKPALANAIAGLLAALEELAIEDNLI